MVEPVIKTLKGGSIGSDLPEAVARKIGEVEFFLEAETERVLEVQRFWREATVQGLNWEGCGEGES